MPGVITHHLFGREVYQELASVVGLDGGQRDAFLLGNQGPDPLLCLKVLPQAVSARSLGTRLHAQDSQKALQSMHRHFIAAPWKPGHEACKAYALGFLCHYLLDSCVHPLVYAQQYALCDAGVAGLSRAQGGREVHALIETAIDEYVLTLKTGTTVAAFSPHREILQCPAEVLSPISARFKRVALESCGLKVSPVAFSASVVMYRAAQKALDSKRDGLRSRIDYARLAGKSYLHVQALTHADKLLPHTPFTNDDHVPWPHPFKEGDVMSASFDELYARALGRALRAIPQFAREDFRLASCVDVPCDVNFYGQPIERSNRLHLL